VSLLKWVAVVVLGASLGIAHAAESDFTLTDAAGVSHDLKEYRGKWVVVNFWATWCPPCLEEIPDLIAFHAKHKDLDAVVVGVDYEDIGDEQLSRFVKKLAISYPVLRADPDESQEFGEVPALPTTFLINPQGEKVARQVGPITATALESYIRRKSAAQVKQPPVAVPSHGL